MRHLQSLITVAFFIGCVLPAMAQCNGGHSTDPGDMWLTCDGATNPNPERTEQHWIQYDFGTPYILNDSHFWNYNVPGATDNGLQEITIDISMNGSDWTSWGGFTLSLASGSEDYQGQAGPAFDGIEAQFLLISVSSNYGGECYGLSEMKIDVDPGSVSVDEPDLAAIEFGLFPNPTREICTIQLEDFKNAEIRLLSVSGAMLRNVRPESATTRFQVGDLPAGIYLVQVVNDDGASGVKRLAITK